jgi:hypothetical protein
MFKENTGLVLNCGYARTAICQLYGKPPSEKGKKKTSNPSKVQSKTNSTNDTSLELSLGSKVSPYKENGMPRLLESEVEGVVSTVSKTSNKLQCHVEGQGNRTDVNMQSSDNTDGACSSSSSTHITVQLAHEQTTQDSGPRKQIKHLDPQQTFLDNFGAICNLDKSDFITVNATTPSKFDRMVKKVIAAFNSKWHPVEDRSEYIKTFSLAKWQKMDKKSQQSHSVSNCIACAVEHTELQQAMPLRPLFRCENEENLHGPLEQVSAKEFARAHYDKINSLCLSSTGQPFAEVAINHIRPFKNVVKNTQKQCTDEVKKALAENAVIRVHAQDTSFTKYDKQRLGMFYDNPDTTQSKKTKKRWPLKESDCQNTREFQALCHKLQNWDKTEKFVGSALAKQFAIRGTDAGHRIKLLALELGCEIPETEVVPKQRRILKKYQNSDVSMPALPTSKKLKVQEKELLETNIISVGSPCCPLPVTYYKHGERCEKTAMGRKYSLTEIRQKLTDKHRYLMRMYTESQISEMSRDKILALVSKVAPSALPEFESKEIHNMRSLLREYQCNRSLWVWSDHSVLLGYGLVVFVVGAVYNPLVYLTDEEVARSSKSTMSVQETVEQGEVYIIAHCSSSSADQAGLIPERVACLDSLSDPIVLDNGLELHDSLQFFKGDKQSAWFEAGIQRGGNYCCLVCDCHVKDFVDYTAVVQCSKLRNLDDIQKMATCGVFGKVPNKVSSFESLSREQLRQELVNRKIYDFPPNNKKGMTDILKDHLCGVQRVPALLLLNPTVDLCDMNLFKYTVLSFEPLHDLKGHIATLLSKLPSVITQPGVKSKVQEYLFDFHKKPKLYGSDYRNALLQVMHILVLSKLDTNDPVHVLISTLVKISEIVYSNDSKRSPRQCLQFYNCAFLHHVIYIDLFKPDRCSIYFHSMLMHGPVQHELVCSRSTNTEAEERLFKQAGRAAMNTDHKVDGFVESLLIKLQCKQLDSSPEPTCYSQISGEHSRIKQSAKNLPHYRGSHFSKEFIQSHLGEFQCHLQRIAHYLVHGEGVWWHRSPEGTVMFLDSDLDLEYRTEGPNVLHFRSASLKDVSARADQCWRAILQDKIGLPITAVRNYDCSGSVLNVTEFGQSSESDELVTLDPNVSEAMDTTLMSTEDLSGLTYADSDLLSVSNESIPIPITTSTPQRNQHTPVEHSNATAGCDMEPDETESTAVLNTMLPPQVSDSSLREQSATTTAIQSSHRIETTVAASQSSHRIETTTQATAQEYTFQSKLAHALSRTVGNFPELKTLDELTTAGNTNSNEYRLLKLFFRRKLVSLRTKIQIEMVVLERNKQKKTDTYRKMSNDLKKATVLLTHVA